MGPWPKLDHFPHNIDSGRFNQTAAFIKHATAVTIITISDSHQDRSSASDIEFFAFGICQKKQSLPTQSPTSRWTNRESTDFSCHQIQQQRNTCGKQRHR